MSTLEAIRAEHQRLSEWWMAQPAELKAGSPLGLGDSNWTYEGDTHVEASSRLPVIALGLNPGSGNHAVERGMTPSEKAWRTRCTKLAEAPANQIVFAELIAFPTHTAKELDGLGGSLILIERTAPLNIEILRFHRPQIVFQPGLDSARLRLVEQLFQLEPEGRGNRPDRSTELLFESYRTPWGGAWIAFRHFAAMGFSGRDREAIQREAKRLGWAPETAVSSHSAVSRQRSAP